MTIRCVNFMDHEVRMAAMKAYHEKWGARNADGTFEEEWSEPFELIENEHCYECEFGIERTARLLQVIKAASGDLTSQVAIRIREMTGEPMIRTCFKKREKENDEELDEKT